MNPAPVKMRIPDDRRFAEASDSLIRSHDWLSHFRPMSASTSDGYHTYKRSNPGRQWRPDPGDESPTGPARQRLAGRSAPILAQKVAPKCGDPSSGPRSLRSRSTHVSPEQPSNFRLFCSISSLTWAVTNECLHQGFHIVSMTIAFCACRVYMHSHNSSRV